MYGGGMPPFFTRKLQQLAFLQFRRKKTVKMPQTLAFAIITQLLIFTAS